IGRVVVLRAEKSRHRERIGRGPTKHITRGPHAARMPPGAVELSYLEKKVLLALGKLEKASPDEIRAAGKFHELVEVMNAASGLQAKGPDEILLARLAKGELTEDSIDPHVLRDLKSRRELVKERESVRREIALTPAGQKVLAAGIELKEEVAQPTTDLLRSGKWRSV